MNSINTGRLLRYSSKALTVLMFFLFFGHSAQATLAWDNGNPSNGNAYVSDPTFPIQYGDNFTLSSTTVISKIEWFGAYKGSSLTANPTDAFSLRVFRFTNGAPENTPILLLSPSGVARTLTGGVLPLGNFVYDYQANITPTSLLPGQYLVSVINNTLGQPDQWMWALHQSVSGDKCWMRFRDTDAWGGPYGSEFAFKLYSPDPIPEPATLIFGFRVGRCSLGPPHQGIAWRLIDRAITETPHPGPTVSGDDQAGGSSLRCVCPAHAGRG